MPIKKLKDGTEYEKATHHTESILRGIWTVTKKIDGVRAMRNAKGAVVSRNGEPLHNLDHLQFSDAEVFRKDWSTSVSLVRTQSYKEINQDDIYELSKLTYDKRLATDDVLTNSTYDERMALMEKYVAQGYEGIVLRKQGDIEKWVKVVPYITVDVRVTGVVMGKTGKNIGHLGSFETAHGCFAGFTAAEKAEMEANGLDTYIGKICEVEFREWTPAKKMRFARVSRDKTGAALWRFDKDEESLT